MIIDHCCNDHDDDDDDDEDDDDDDDDDKDDVDWSLRDSPVRYVLKIHFFIEAGRKMIQFKIQFKTKFKIFIQ